jgi:hypothetical protein
MHKNSELERTQTSSRWHRRVEVLKEKVERIIDDTNALGKRLDPINRNAAPNVSTPKPRTNVIRETGSQLRADCAGNDYNGVDIPSLPFELTGVNPTVPSINPHDNLLYCPRFIGDKSLSLGGAPHFFQRQPQSLFPDYDEEIKRVNNASRRKDHPGVEPRPDGSDFFLTL